MKYICDTNFIIRYLIEDYQEMFLKTKEIFEKTKNGENILIIEQTYLDLEILLRVRAYLNWI